MDEILLKIPIDIANKILNYAISIEVYKQSEKKKNVNNELFNGYWIEENENQIILKTSYDYEIFGHKNYYTLFDSRLSKSNRKNILNQIPRHIVKDILPCNFLNYTDSKVSSDELKNVEYEWITRIPKLED